MRLMVASLRVKSEGLAGDFEIPTDFVLLTTKP